MHASFPKLKSAGYSVTSPPTPRYNCIAWAAGDTARYWWPMNYSYWPRGVPRELSEEAFVAAYATLGYERCESGALETGYEKIAIYSKDGEPTHAARQLHDGKWTSKLGPQDDICHHTPEAVEGPEYGSLALYMRRASAPPRPEGNSPAAPPGSQRSSSRKIRTK